MEHTRRRFLSLAAAAAAGAMFTEKRLAMAHTDTLPEGMNALEHQTYDMLQGWFDWLRGAGVPGYLGETNTPNSQKPWPATEVNKWLTLLDKALVWCDEAGLHSLTIHAASPTEGGGQGLKAYGVKEGGAYLANPLSEAYEQAAVIEPRFRNSAFMRGVNATGGVFMPFGFSAQNPQVYRKDYVYPDEADYRFLYDRGHRLVRVGFRWERVQQAKFGALHQQELAYLRQSFDAAHSVGTKVVLDMHNYTDYVYGVNRYGSPQTWKLGSASLPNSALADAWGKLAEVFMDHPAVAGYDIMNEPRKMPGSTRRGQAVKWEQAAQLTLDAIRKYDPDTMVWVSGYHEGFWQGNTAYNGVGSFVANHPNPFITGTNFGYTAHVYYGPNAAYDTSYDEVVLDWERKGYGV